MVRISRFINAKDIIQENLEITAHYATEFVPHGFQFHYDGDKCIPGYH